MYVVFIEFYHFTEMPISLNIHCARILSAHREIERQKDKEGEEREGLGEIGRKGREEERGGRE